MLRLLEATGFTLRARFPMNAVSRQVGRTQGDAPTLLQQRMQTRLNCSLVRLEEPYQIRP
jgi:hypothetical protein